MKKFLSLLLVLCCLTGLLTAATAEEELSDALRFKQEHEQLNGQVTLDGSHEYAAMEIPEDNCFVYAGIEDIVSLLTDGSGTIYFGFPECPWCRTLLPVLVEAVQATAYEGPIYYYNALTDRDARYLDEETGEIVVDHEGTENYTIIMELLGDYFWEYQGLNDPTIKRLYFPTMVFVKDGEVQSLHIDTIEGQESGYDPLTEEQHDALLNILMEGLNSTLGE